MADYKKDYVQFYIDTYRSIAEVIKEREGLTVRMEPLFFNPIAQASMSRPDFSNSRENESISKNTSKVEPFSLSQYAFGIYIDEKYKERFLHKMALDGHYDKNKMSSLIYEVANDLYEHFLKKDTNDMSRIFSRMHYWGFEDLSSEEKQRFKEVFK